MSTDAIVLLKQDHKRLRALFGEFEQCPENAYDVLVARILESLVPHNYLKTGCMYPTVRRLLPDLEDDIRELYAEHRATDELCAELAAMTPADPYFGEKAMLLVETVSRHMDELEFSWFPKVREGIGRKKMQEIGSWLLQMRDNAPAVRHRSFVTTG